MLRRILGGALGLATFGAAAAAAGQEAPEPEPVRGLLLHTPEAAPGYTLISPFSTGFAYLLDLEGRVVHQWESDYRPGLAPYLLPDGNLLRGIRLEVPTRYEGGGQAGGLQEFTWDGELVWEYHFATNRFFHHHDVEPLPNGNILLIAWEYRSRDEALAAGRRADAAGEDGFWPDFVVEVEPLRPYGARVVWEWHAFDHLIQDTDPALAHHGVVAEHPERIDINGDLPRRPEDAVGTALSSEDRSALQALGYLAEDPVDGEAPAGGAAATGDADHDNDDESDRKRADWLHINAIDYNAELDQIAVSLWHMNEIWVIDHSTTTAEARGSTGGRSGRGGDLLYRWGNPQTYLLGAEADRQLFHQHDVQWVPAGHPGAGNLTIFNNGRHRPDEEYSSVLEIVPPRAPDGTYVRAAGQAFGPAAPLWEYAPRGDEQFFASFISGAHRLANGNTLVCSGPDGRLMEVTRAGQKVWEYLNPFGKFGERGPRDFAHGMFRATRIAPDHPGLQGRALTPLEPQPKTAQELWDERPPPGEQASGWQPLFDEELGLSRWQPVNVAADRTFEIRPDPDDEDELILWCSGKPTGILRSDRMYENFIVEMEWRHLEEEGNAGFFVWADPLPAVGGPFTRGIEVQICNLGNGTWFTSHGDIFPIWGATMTPDPRFRISGSRSMPREDAFHGRPTGEWNHYRITCVDGAITLEVNSHLVAAGSACTPSKGYLCLESEGGEIHYRNLRLWELPAGSHAADAARTARPAGDERSLYSGLDLEGWEVRQGTWIAEDWRLISREEPAMLEIELPESSRRLFFDYLRQRSPPGGLLPFRLGEHRFAAEGETPGQWNRVEVTWTATEVTLELAGKRQTLPIALPSPPPLTLMNDGLATEYCSVFADAP